MPDNLTRRTIRSFVIRSGRLTESQQKALIDYLPCFGITYSPSVIDFVEVFGRKSDIVLEIGFGMGDSLIAMALQNPHQDYIGIDVHRPGVGRVLHEIVRNDLKNLRILCHDAIDVLQNCLADGSLHGIQIYFPDPWPKKRHHKRRLIQPEFVELLTQKLKLKGFIHLATDWGPYAEQMMTILNQVEGLQNTTGNNQYSTHTNRPTTKFERRGQKLGHEVWDMIFQKVL